MKRFKNKIFVFCWNEEDVAIIRNHRSGPKQKFIIFLENKKGGNVFKIV